MKLSSRVIGAKESATLKVNESVSKLAQSGKLIYNMTAGQLPFKPLPEFVQCLSQQLNFLKSYQYAPILGFPQLREKLLKHVQKKREISFEKSGAQFGCIVSNGSKHSIYNVLGTLIDPGDEVIILSPYWVSYPEMIKFWGGVPVEIMAHAFDAYIPHIQEIEKALSSRTKAIIINSPNNPSGTHYLSSWMKEFAEFLKRYPDIMVISDELYSELCYFDPRPTYFYQYDQSLLAQTIIIDGISKSFACTGLRIGYCFAPEKIILAMGVIQSQTTSGASSLVQKSLVEFDFALLENFFDPVKVQLRECAQILREEFRKGGMPHCWYQTTSGFYFMLDFSRTPLFEKYKSEENHDASQEICEMILEETGVALVPGSAFGYPNSARMSMTLEVAPFKEGISRLVERLSRT